MISLADIGCIFYGTAIAEMGLQEIFYRDFPYMLLPSGHFPGFAAIAYVLGLVFTLAGACIVFKKNTRQMAVLLGSVFLLIVFLCHIPYEFISGSNYRHLSEWENAEKVLALAGGAFTVAGCFPEKDESPVFSFLGKPVPFGPLIFALMIVAFSMLHFVYAKPASGYIPSWIPNHMFWIYFAGAALLGSGIAIILKIKTRLIATLLGAMILVWFVSLHIPKIFTAIPADRPGEITSAFLALAYSGTAFIIAGNASAKHSN